MQIAVIRPANTSDDGVEVKRTTAVQAGPNDAPFRATLTVQETIAEDTSCPS